MQKQKFYIIGHNPNTLEEAEDFLKAGANALEPDICFDKSKPEQFFVSHGPPVGNPFTAEHSLVNYLTGLRKLITDPRINYNLAMITFDIKTPTFDINKFISIVFENFSSFAICDGVALIITVPSLTSVGFLNAYDQTKPNLAIGVDDEKSAKNVEAAFKASGQKKIVYANGNIVGNVELGLFKSIMAAKGVQAIGQGNSFSIIYTWVLHRNSSIRSFLDVHIDGIIVDLDVVPRLLKILREDHFSAMYELAQNSYNPFIGPPPSRYLLTIKTRDVNFAGTDVPVKFTIVGLKGMLETTLDCDFKDVMERGETDFLTLEGNDIGQIVCLTVAQLRSGINSGWLPESIKLESPLIPAPLTFNYGPNEWVDHEHPITKLPS